MQLTTDYGDGLANIGCCHQVTYRYFFGAAVLSAGNHDNRSYDDASSEQCQGLFRKLSDSADGFPNEPYMIRRPGDYFARNLLGVDLLAGYQIKGPTPQPWRAGHPGTLLAS